MEQKTAKNKIENENSSSKNMNANIIHKYIDDCFFVIRTYICMCIIYRERMNEN